jgi:Zn-dependent peptidase ImmA (M78 family)/transcriptional regulator with XRE-family HTH domain
LERQNLIKMSNVCIPEMLILAREFRGLTQTELARACGLSQANISKYENGLVEVPASNLDEIALTLRFPVRFFFVHADRTGLGPSVIYHRRRQSVSVMDVKRIEALANVQRIRITSLLRGGVVQTHPGLDIPAIDIEDYGHNAAAVARDVRQALMVPFGPVNNLVNLIERSGGIILRTRFGTKKFDGVSQALPLPSMFFLNSEMPNDRCRHTLAHELGHVVMHRRIPSDNAEAEADEFASEFLMPEELISKDLNNLTLSKLISLKAEWKVSMASLVMRAKKLGKIGDRQSTEWFMKFGKAGYRSQGEPYPLPTEEPTVVKQLIRIHREHHGYSLEELEELMFTKRDEIEDQFGSMQSQVQVLG